MERGQNYIGYCHVNIIVSRRVGEWVLCVAVACLSTMCTNLLIVQSTELEQLSLLRSQLSMKKTTMAALIAHQQGQPTNRLPDGWEKGANHTSIVYRQLSRPAQSVASLQGG